MKAFSRVLRWVSESMPYKKEDKAVPAGFAQVPTGATR